MMLNTKYKVEIPLITAILFWVFLTGCSVNNSKIEGANIAGVSNADTLLAPSNNKQYYFPFKVAGDSGASGIDTFENKWYSVQLFAMKEPVIYSGKSENEIYRFTWLRSFHHPIAIRVEKHEETYILTWKMCNGAGGYRPGKLIVYKQLIIDKANWSEFKSQIDQMDFWNLKTHQKVFGCDGAEWILEGKKGNSYHIVDRWSDEGPAEYYKCCKYLLSLTKIDIPKKEIY